jgi:hypothetical protein
VRRDPLAGIARITGVPPGAARLARDDIAANPTFLPGRAQASSGFLTWRIAAMMFAGAAFSSLAVRASAHFEAPKS